ncbi:MAG: selenoneine biosynthesis selenosugar synthase SenB [Polaromonas sp.]
MRYLKSKIVLISPATAKANNGNWHTAHRWAKFLSDDCDIAVLQDWNTADIDSDAMIALHARRSAPSIHAWAAQHPGKPLIVVLTGTDLYRDIQFDAAAQTSLRLATHLVVLQEAGLAALPAGLRAKARVIFQSTSRLVPAVKSARRLTAVMVGHLRDEKDPRTFMKAARLCDSKTVHFEQIGDGLDAQLACVAKKTALEQTHYRWLGGLPRAATRQRIKHAHVLVNASVIEGGAHVILEAVQSGTPVLASHISGNVGMLGADYAGYFEVGDALALTALLKRCATEPAFLAHLQSQCAQRAELFEPALEKRLVLNLVNSALKEPS